jgi:hypothetical protein
MRAFKLVMVVVLALLAGPLFAADAPLADQLPGQSIAYVGWAGQNDALDNSAYGKLLADPIVANSYQALIDGLKKRAAENGGDDEAALYAVKLGHILVRHPLAVGVLGFDPEKPEATPAMLVADLAGDKAAFQAELDKLVALSDGAIKKARIGATDLLMLDADGVQLALGWEGNLLKLAVNKQAIDAAFIPVDGKRFTLRNNQLFVADMKKIDLPQSQSVMWVDVQAAYKAMAIVLEGPAATRPATMPTTQPTPRDVIDALGLGKVTSIVSVSGFDGLATLGEMRINSPAPHKGVLAMLAAKELPADALADAPADTILAVAARMSPTDLLAEVRRIAGQLDPDAPEQIDEALAQAGGMFGIDVRQDVLAALGDQWQLVSAPSLGGYGTGTVLSVSLEDSQKFAAAVEKATAPFAQGAGGVNLFKASAKDGTAISYLSQAASDEPQPLSFFSPAWAITNDRLIVGPYPQPVKTVLEGSIAKRLGDDKRFQSLRKRMPKSVSIIGYNDATGLLPLYYTYGQVGYNVGASFARGQGFGLMPHWMPTLMSIKDYFSPEMSAVSSDDDGIRVTTASEGVSISGSPMVELPLLVSIVLPALNNARESAKMAAAGASLRGIGAGILLFYEDNNRSYPTDLSAVVKAGFIPAEHLEILRAPQNDAPAPRLVDGKLVGEVDYVYLKPEGEPKPSDIIGYLKPEFAHKGMVPVLFGDLHIEQMPVWQLQRRLSGEDEADAPVPVQQGW